MQRGQQQPAVPWKAVRTRFIERVTMSAASAGQGDGMCAAASPGWVQTSNEEGHRTWFGRLNIAQAQTSPSRLIRTCMCAPSMYICAAGVSCNSHRHSAATWYSSCLPLGALRPKGRTDRHGCEHPAESTRRSCVVCGARPPDFAHILVLPGGGVAASRVLLP